MTCIIIEDQLPAQRILSKYIHDFGSLTLLASFSNALQALEFLQTNKVDLLFLDIHLPKLSGLDFLKALSNPPQVILTTAFPDYALESYECSVVDYLLKPFSFQRFLKAVAKVSLPQQNHSPNAPSAFPKNLFIKTGYEHIKIVIQDILYIKSDADYTELFLAEKKYLSTESLRHWEETLDGQCFIRIQKSYLVNIAKIEKVAGNTAYLTGNRQVPIGRAYKENFINRLHAPL
ncbi:MAG: LytR/AlgR family response regulator transcription factor [Aureispira sp.]